MGLTLLLRDDAIRVGESELSGVLMEDTGSDYLLCAPCALKYVFPFNNLEITDAKAQLDRWRHMGRHTLPLPDVACNYCRTPTSVRDLVFLHYSRMDWSLREVCDRNAEEQRRTILAELPGMLAS